MLNLILVSFFSGILVHILSDVAIVNFIVVFGQAHFLIAYLYQKKAGRVDKKYLTKLAILLVFIGGMCTFVFYNKNFFSLLVFITITIFVYHYFKDEFKTQGFESTPDKLFAILSVLFSFISVFLVKIFNLSIAFVLPFILVSVLLSYVYFSKVSKKIKNTKEMYQLFLFFGLNIIVPISLIYLENVTLLKIAGFIIFFHYIRWYIYYFSKFRDAELSYYSNVVILINLFTLILFVLYSKIPYFSFLYLFFDPVYFYGWTLLHIFLTLKKVDFS